LYLSIHQGGTIPSEFNNTEPDMDKLRSQTSKEAAWRSRLQQHAQSAQSIAHAVAMMRSRPPALIFGGQSWPSPANTSQSRTASSIHSNRWLYENCISF